MEEIRQAMEQRLHRFLAEDQDEGWWSGVGTGFPGREFGTEIHQPHEDLERLYQGLEDATEARQQSWMEEDLCYALQRADEEEAVREAKRVERKLREQEQAEETRARAKRDAKKARQCQAEAVRKQAEAEAERQRQAAAEAREARRKRSKTKQQRKDYTKAKWVAATHRANAEAEEQQAEGEAARENDGTPSSAEQTQRIEGPMTPTHHQNQNNEEQNCQELALPEKRSYAEPPKERRVGGKGQDARDPQESGPPNKAEERAGECARKCLMPRPGRIPGQQAEENKKHCDEMMQENKGCSQQEVMCNGNTRSKESWQGEQRQENIDKAINLVAAEIRKQKPPARRAKIRPPPERDRYGSVQRVMMEARQTGFRKGVLDLGKSKLPRSSWKQSQARLYIREAHVSYFVPTRQ